MNLKEIQAILDQGVTVGSFPIPATFKVGTCDRTGRPKISCGLFAPDTRLEGGFGIQTGIKAGGIGWPPHTVVLDSTDPTEEEIFSAAHAAFDKALVHEGDEHFKVRGRFHRDPHPNG